MIYQCQTKAHVNSTILLISLDEEETDFLLLRLLFTALIIFRGKKHNIFSNQLNNFYIVCLFNWQKFTYVAIVFSEAEGLMSAKDLSSICDFVKGILCL